MQCSLCSSAACHAIFLHCKIWGILSFYETSGTPCNLRAYFSDETGIWVRAHVEIRMIQSQVTQIMTNGGIFLRSFANIWAYGTSFSHEKQTLQSCRSVIRPNQWRLKRECLFYKHQGVVWLFGSTKTQSTCLFCKLTKSAIPCDWLSPTSMTSRLGRVARSGSPYPVYLAK
jgi:hypothetical protein